MFDRLYVTLIFKKCGNDIIKSKSNDVFMTKSYVIVNVVFFLGRGVIFSQKMECQKRPFQMVGKERMDCIRWGSPEGVYLELHLMPPRLPKTLLMDGGPLRTARIIVIPILSYRGTHEIINAIIIMKTSL